MSEYIISDELDVLRSWMPKLTEIVRCRDCKHYNTKLTDEYDGTSWCCIHAGYAFPDDYCSWAERREL